MTARSLTFIFLPYNLHAFTILITKINLSEGGDSLDSHVEHRNLKAPWLQSAKVENLKQT